MMKVYKMTLQVCMLVLFALTILSVVLSLWNGNEWISFAVDWCVGIACSIIVVIITTVIQFKAEQNRAIKELGAEVKSLLFHNQFEGFIFDDMPYATELQTQEKNYFEQRWFDCIQEDVKTIWRVCSELQFFFRPQKLLIIMRFCTGLRLVMIQGKNKRESYSSSQYNIYGLAKAMLALNLSINEYDHKDIEEYIAAYEKKCKS